MRVFERVLSELDLLLTNSAGPPNPAVNADAPVRGFYLVGGGAGAPITLIR